MNINTYHRLLCGFVVLSCVHAFCTPVTYADSINYDSDTNTAFMTIDEPFEGTANLALRFGGTLQESLKFNRTTDRFVFSNDLYVIGSVDAFTTLSGASVVTRNLVGSQNATTGSILVSRTGNAPEWKSPTSTMVWYLDGTLAVGGKQGAIVNMPFGMTVTDIDIRMNGAPTGAAVIVDIKENNTTIFSTKPQVSDGATSEAGTHVFSDTDLAQDSTITFDVNQVGSTFAGSGMTVMLKGIRKY